MALLAIDLGGTKLAVGIVSESGNILSREAEALNGRSGKEVGQLIIKHVRNNIGLNEPINAIGVAVPGIYNSRQGTVWAPNIKGWEDYPLFAELKAEAGDIPVVIDSDRVCYILGEVWHGNAKGCSDAIFVSVGTGIGAGILIGGQVLRGAHDIAGSIGWMALQHPFHEKYISCGCFEYHASGEGIARVAQEKLNSRTYGSSLSQTSTGAITAHDVFEAYAQQDQLAIEIVSECIIYWGMAVANLVSIFNPQKIIFGGGIFGPATPLIPAIREEATKWAQPISMKKVQLEASALGADVALYGAGYLAQKFITLKTGTDALQS